MHSDTFYNFTSFWKSFETLSCWKFRGISSLKKCQTIYYSANLKMCAIVTSVKMTNTNVKSGKVSADRLFCVPTFFPFWLKRTTIVLAFWIFVNGHWRSLFNSWKRLGSMRTRKSKIFSMKLFWYKIYFVYRYIPHCVTKSVVLFVVSWGLCNQIDCSTHPIHSGTF